MPDNALQPTSERKKKKPPPSSRSDESLENVDQNAGQEDDTQDDLGIWAAHPYTLAPPTPILFHKPRTPVRLANSRKQNLSLGGELTLRKNFIKGSSCMCFGLDRAKATGLAPARSRHLSLIIAVAALARIWTQERITSDRPGTPHLGRTQASR